MKMCLAPCFGGCSKEDYDVEVNRLVQFLETGGASLRASYETEREKASENLDFERASSIHKKLEKIDEALRGQPELPRRIQDLNAVILQRASAEQTIAVFPVFAGRVAEPSFVSFSQFAGEPRSAEQVLRARLEDPAAEPLTGDLSENLWLVARWFYSNPREGEIFFREKGWPYRRMMRACARLLAPPEQSETTPPTPAADNKGDQPPQ